jgi:sugar phosphate isomerase/epimerase
MGVLRMSEMNRRGFVTAVGAAGAALAAGAGARPSGSAPPVVRGRTLDRIGVQLYTVRRALRQDFDGTIARVAAVGYKEVEFFVDSYAGRTPQQVRAALDKHGLTAPSTHLDFGLLEKGWEETIAAGHVVGYKYLTMAWIPDSRRKTLDDWHRTADLFNRSAETAKKAGMGFAYHNHNYEFMPLEGQLPYDVLTAATDPATVMLEIDLYWIASKGVDPFTYFTRYPGRTRMVHAKDMDAAGKMLDVGDGKIDFKKILAARSQAGIEHVFVEHDEPTDPMGSITRSYEYLRKLEF